MKDNNVHRLDFSGFGFLDIIPDSVSHSRCYRIYCMKWYFPAVRERCQHLITSVMNGIGGGPSRFLA